MDESLPVVDFEDFYEGGAAEKESTVNYCQSWRNDEAFVQPVRLSAPRNFRLLMLMNKTSKL